MFHQPSRMYFLLFQWCIMVLAVAPKEFVYIAALVEGSYIVF